MSTPMALDDGIDEKEAWELAADRVISPLLKTGEVFSSDTLHEGIEQMAPGTYANLKPGQRSAWPGTYFQQLAEAGVIVKDGYGASTRKSRRAGSRYEWRVAS